MKYRIRIRTKRLYKGNFIPCGVNEFTVDAENSYKALIESARIANEQGYVKGEVELISITETD